MSNLIPHEFVQGEGLTCDLYFMDGNGGKARRCGRVEELHEMVQSGEELPHLGLDSGPKGVKMEPVE